MARLIDSDKRITEIKNQYCTGCDNYGGVRCRACFVDDAICLIDDAPTVDAVEVVRCRDCKHLVLTAEGEHNPCDCVCDYWQTDGLNDNDFCSYGERMDGDWNG